MIDPPRSLLFNLQARGDWVRLRTLVTLRWIAILGQTAAVLIASQGLGFQLPLGGCAGLISASICVNLVTSLVYPAEKRLSEQGTLASLFYDLAQLVALVMLTGGLNNPFALLILAPVTISATALRLQSTLWLGINAMAALVLLQIAYVPLIAADGQALEVPPVFQTGVAAALAIGIVFLGLYARRVTVEGYAMSQALNATQIALAREQRLAAIGGIAAATAHELGTPLATIKLVAGELARELRDRPDLAEDLALIRSEVERCGAIMADLGKGGRDDNQVKIAPISAVLCEAIEPHRNRGKHVILRIDGAPSDLSGDDQPHVQRSPELIHGLRNLVQNAVDFAATTVWVDVDAIGPRLRIAVGDDGPGFAAEILPRLGEPYVSTRARGQPTKGDEEYQGLGLGLFIARTLLERTGAEISFANGSDGRRRDAGEIVPPDLARPPGAIIELIWPPDTLAMPSRVARAALGPNQRFVRRG